MIDDFHGENFFLDNFFPAPVAYNGILYPTTEHAYQSQKCLDKEWKQRMATLPTPGAAKLEGNSRRIELRLDWEQVKDNVMLIVCRLKFLNSANLGMRLLLTGKDNLVEGNTWHDNYWGRCNCEDCARSNCIARNQLGKTLMKVRGELREIIDKLEIFSVKTA